MKIRSLLLGSVAAAGLATGAYAADASTVLSALNACDSLGISGITIASDDTCIQVTGEVKWEGNWGDFNGPSVIGVTTGVVAPATGVDIAVTPASGLVGVPSPSGTTVSTGGTNDTVTTVAHPGGAGTGFAIATPGASPAGGNLDWASKLEWYIRFKATSDTANGPASAVIKFKQIDQYGVTNELPIVGKDSPYDTDPFPEPGTGGDHTFGIIADEAYVSIGSSNVFMIGKMPSLLDRGKGDDEPLNFLALFNSEKVDKGVFYSTTGGTIGTGGIGIQTTNELGNGFFVSGALENLQATDAMAGTAIGLLEYKGDGVTAHVTGLAGGFLDGTIEKFALHAGATATFDTVTIRAAIAADSSGYYNALATAAVTFDMFKIAVSGEAASGNDYGVGGSIGATVADGIELNLGGRFYHDDGAGPDGYQVAASIAAAVTETIKLTAELGVYGNDAALTVPYGALEAAYAPGGGFTASVKGEVYANGAYKGTVKAGKTF
jgi:hypothetical protein